MSSFGEPIASAAVELRVDTSKVNKDADEGVLGLKHSLAKASALWADIMADAEKAGEGIQSSFEEAGRQSDDALDKIGGSEVWGDVTRQAEKTGENIESSMREAATQSNKHLDGIKNTASGMFSTIAGLAAAAGVGFFLKDSVTQADDAAAGMRELQSIIEATGSAAGLTADQVAGIAQDLSIKIGVDDDDIIEAQGVLLTFKQIGGDSFSRVTQDAADMAAVFGGDLSSAATQLGKALNDPTQGVSALTRVGVTFTDAQKEQIKAMQEAGDVAGAQEIILRELEGQVAGAAEASATGAQKISVAFGEMKESLGAGIGGAIESLAPQVVGLLDGLQAPLGKLGESLGAAIGPLFDAFGPAFGVLIRQFGKVMTDVGSIIGSLAPLLSPVVQVVGVLATFLSGALASAFKALEPTIKTVSKFLDTFAEVLGDILFETLEALEPTLEVIGGILDDVFATVLPVVIDLFRQLAPIITQIGTILGDTLAAVLPVVAAAFHAVFDALAPVIPALMTFLHSILEALAPVLPEIAKSLIELTLAFVPLLTAILPILEPLLELATILIDKIGAPVILAIAAAIDIYVEAQGKLAQIIGDLLVPVVQKLTEWIRFVIDHLQEWWDKTEGVRGFLEGVFAGVLAALVVALGAVRDALGWVADKGVDLWNRLEPVRAFLADAFSVGVAVATTTLGLLRDAFGWVIDKAQALWDKLEPFRSFLAAAFSTGLGVATTALGLVRDGLQWVLDKAEDAWDTLGPFVSFMSSVFATGLGVAKSALEGIRDAFQWIIDKVETLIGWIGKIKFPEVPSWVKTGISAVNPFDAVGRIVTSPRLSWTGERGPEAIIPITMPGRAMQLMSQSGLGEMWDRLRGGGGGHDGPLVSFPGATFQDATDADLVAQRVNVAVMTRMVAT